MRVQPMSWGIVFRGAAVKKQWKNIWKRQKILAVKSEGALSIENSKKN